MAAGHGGGIVGRDEGLENPGCARGGDAPGAEEVLVGDGNACQRPEGLPRGALLINPRRLGLGSVSRKAHEGLDVILHLPDSVKARGDCLSGADLLGLKLLRQFVRGQMG